MDKYRQIFPILDRVTFLNHAASAPTSLRVAGILMKFAQNLSHYGGLYYSMWMRHIEEVRELVAKLVNAQPREIAFIGNTSEGLSLVANAVKWKAGDVVVVPELDFPANIYPWMNLRHLGVETKYIKRQNGIFTIKDVKNALCSRVKLISVSSVDYRTGFRCDLETLGQLCREEGILFCLDAIQSLGVIPMDVKKCGAHFLSCGGHKWLMSTLGIGFLYVSSEIIDTMYPSRVGWKSVKQEENFSKIALDLKPGASRLEPGTMNVAGIYALGKALELLFEVGIDRIQRKVFALNDLLVEALKERGIKIVSPLRNRQRSGIISFVPPVNAEAFYSYLLQKCIIVSLRNGYIRVSPHFYNNKTDIKRFIDTLDEHKTI